MRRAVRRRPSRRAVLSVLTASLTLSTTACSRLTPEELGTAPPSSTTAATTGDPEASPATTSDSGTTAEPGEGAPTTGAPVADTPPPLVGRFVASPVGTYVHDDLAYTQGLEYLDGLLLESTGHVGESDRRWVDPVTGEVITRVANQAEHFGEGITVVGDVVIQLTWLTGVAVVADRESLVELDRFTYPGEGWGLCYDGAVLYMSDGSDRLTRRDPTTFVPVGDVAVTLDGRPVTELNELECVGGQVVANVLGSDELVVIDPATGAVDAVIDAASLRPPDRPVDDTDYALNGVAYDPDSGRWFLTGKWWPVLYEVELVPRG